MPIEVLTVLYLGFGRPGRSEPSKSGGVHWAGTLNYFLVGEVLIDSLRQLQGVH